MSKEEIGRLWTWGMHEDQVFNDRLSFFALAESILFTSAIVIHAQHQERFIESAIAVAGLIFSAAWCLLLEKHALLVELLRQRMKDADPLHSVITNEINALRGWRGRVVRKQMLARGIPSMFALLWLAFVVSGIT